MLSIKIIYIAIAAAILQLTFHVKAFNVHPSTNAMCRQQPMVTRRPMANGEEEDDQSMLSVKDDDNAIVSDYNYIIRPAERSEINEITKVLVQSFYPNINPDDSDFFTKQKYEILELMFDAPSSRRELFVACCTNDMNDNSNNNTQSKEQRIVGYASIDSIKVRGADRILGPQPKPSISELAVLPCHRRRGVATLLMEACEKWATSTHCEECQVYLSVNRENEGARRFYDRLGYGEAKNLDYGKMSSLHKRRMENTLVWLEKSI